MSAGKVLLGVLAGAAAGTLLGVLFAPEKGTETRRRLSRQGREYADDVRERFEDLLEATAEKFDEASELARHAKSRVRSMGNGVEA